MLATLKPQLRAGARPTTSVPISMRPSLRILSASSRPRLVRAASSKKQQGGPPGRPELTPGEKAAVTRHLHDPDGQHLHFLEGHPEKAAAAKEYEKEVKAKEKANEHLGRDLTPGQKAVVTKHLHDPEHHHLKFLVDHPEKAAAVKEYEKQVKAREKAPPANKSDKRHGDPEHGGLTSGEKAAVTRHAHGEAEIHFTEEHPELAKAADAYEKEVKVKERREVDEERAKHGHSKGHE